MQADERASALKPAWREFFQFERRETVAFAALTLILAVGCGLLWLAPEPGALRVIQVPVAAQLPAEIAAVAGPRAGNPLAVIPRAVNLNTATLDELVSLPGIGPKKAQAILDDRAARGRYASVDALDRVKGIGPATVKRLRSHVTVADGATSDGSRSLVSEGTR